MNDVFLHQKIFFFLENDDIGRVHALCKLA